MKPITPTKLMRVLQQLFRVQAQEAARLTTLEGGPPDMSGWVRPMAEALKPLLLQVTQQGMIQSAARIAAKTGMREPATTSRPDLTAGLRTTRPGNDAIFGKGFGRGGPGHPARTAMGIDRGRAPGLPSLTLKRRTRLVCKAATADASFSFDLFNPRVLEAVDRATLALCQETMDTATRDAKQAVEDLRRLLKRGLPKGEAVDALAKKVRRVFADPYRAFRIATTENSRALHDGQLMAAVQSGVVTGKTWLASSDACDDCLALDGKTVGLHQPFHIDPKGGPYAIIQYPPLHPQCLCSFAEEIG